MDAGANTKIEISSGENPLYIAAQMDHIEIVKLILSEVQMFEKAEPAAFSFMMGVFFFCSAACYMFFA